MNTLVTAGNTFVPIDRVRGITNIFTGRTGAAIALEAHRRGHVVTLLTSHPAVLNETAGASGLTDSRRWQLEAFNTFDELEALLARNISHPRIDAVVHCAAVSDYRSAGIYAPAPGTHFDPERSSWENDSGQRPALIDRALPKVKSDAPELWLRLLQTPKLIDFFRTKWGFRGILTKFKLEVATPEAELIAIAERSRIQSQADLMVANTLEGARDWALLGPIDGSYRRIRRHDLPAELLSTLERKYEERQHG